MIQKYGLGWRIADDGNGTNWIGHSGGSIGGTTSFWILPESGLVIAAISNLSDFDFATVLVSLSEVF
ncbi:MAG: serine beta-lactamase-like protein LACTB [Lysobacterales bacterium]